MTCKKPILNKEILILFSALRPEIRHFRIHKNCYFPVKLVVSAIIFVHSCSCGKINYGATMFNFRFTFIFTLC